MNELVIKNIYNNIVKNGGATLNADLHDVTKEAGSGYCVSLAGSEVKIKNNFKLFKKQLKKAIKKNDSYNIGCWLYNNMIYFDNSVIIKELEEALQVGHKNNQLAIYNIKNNKYIYL